MQLLSITSFSLLYSLLNLQNTDSQTFNPNSMARPLATRGNTATISSIIYSGIQNLLSAIRLLRQRAQSCLFAPIRRHPNDATLLFDTSICIKANILQSLTIGERRTKLIRPWGISLEASIEKRSRFPNHQRLGRIMGFGWRKVVWFWNLGVGGKLWAHSIKMPCSPSGHMQLTLANH